MQEFNPYSTFSRRDDLFLSEFDDENDSIQDLEAVMQQLPEDPAISYESLMKTSKEMDFSIDCIEMMIREHHIDDLKKIDCSFQLEALRGMLLQIMILDPFEISELFSHHFLRLSEMIEDVFVHQLQSLEAMHDERASQSEILWPCSINSIKVAGNLVDHLEGYYQVIKHTPLPAHVENVMDTFSDLLEELHVMRDSILDYTYREAERLYHLDV